MLRHFAVVLGALCAVLTGAAAETPLERGSYLVNAVMVCDGCHTPRGPGGLNTERRFSGGSEVWDTPSYTVSGSNITPDRDTGIGAWSKDDIKRLLISGVRPNGVPVAPQMLYGFYRILTPGDLDAIAIYLRTIKPVSNEVSPPVYKAAAYPVPFPGAEASIGEIVPADPITRGFYLATLAHCMACHSRKPDGTQDFKIWLGKGGYEMKGPFGSVIVSNITSHKEKGVGAWTDAELKRALTEGIGRDGRLFKPPMARQRFLRNSRIDVLPRNGLQDEAQRFGPSLKVSKDANAILLLIFFSTWVLVTHTVPKCVIEQNRDFAGGRCHGLGLAGT